MLKTWLIEQDKKENLIIKNALSASVEYLTIKEFIPYTNLDINTLFLNKLWFSFRKNIPIYIDKSLIKLFGYSGPIFKQKQNLINLMIKYNILYNEYSNDKYKKFTYTLPRV